MRGLIGLLCLWLVAGDRPACVRPEPGRARALPGRGGRAPAATATPPRARRATCRGKHLAGGFQLEDVVRHLDHPEHHAGSRDRHRAVDGRRGDPGDPRGPWPRREDPRSPDAVRPLSPPGRQRRQGDGGLPAHGRAGPERGAAQPVHDPAARVLRPAGGRGPRAVAAGPGQVRRVPRRPRRALRGVPHPVSSRGPARHDAGWARAGSRSTGRGA